MSKQNAKRFWELLEGKICAGELPSVFVNVAGHLCLNDGTGRQIPPRLVPLFPAEVVTSANEKAAEVASQKQAAFDRWMAAQIAHREVLDRRLNEAGFMLLAGENTAVVARGTLRQCREKICMVVRQPRDNYSGRGCWVIMDSTGAEVEAGQFDKHGAI
jgi:hypothetical protein